MLSSLKGKNIWEGEMQLGHNAVKGTLYLIHQGHMRPLFQVRPLNREHIEVAPDRVILPYSRIPTDV